MNAFSADWLALREPADHRARSSELLARLREHFAGRETIRVIDLGTGAASNLRACAGHLPERQEWTLVDNDLALLNAARVRLAAWADHSEDADGTLRLEIQGKKLRVQFIRADLVKELNKAFDGSPDLVTAAAVFDLVSSEWIADFAANLARRNAAFYTALTYNGTERWSPAHSADAAMLAAFHAHQSRDKGFGPAAGPRAPNLLAQAFSAHSYHVQMAASPWRLGIDSSALVKELVQGAATAVRETGLVPTQTVREWLRARLAGASCEIGHTDLIAIPRA